MWRVGALTSKPKPTMKIDKSGPRLWRARGRKVKRATPVRVALLMCGAFRAQDREAEWLFPRKPETLHLDHFFGLRSFGALSHFKLDRLTLFESLEAVAL